VVSTTAHRVINTKQTETFAWRQILNAEISSKLSAFAIALMMNAVIIAGVSYIFDSQMKQQRGDIAAAAQILSPVAGSKCPTSDAVDRRRSASSRERRETVR
jgi:hypothetical protein